MPQARRQENDDDRQSSSSKPPLSPASRSDPLGRPSLAGNLIPRDYLGPRSAGSGSPAKPTPSPLRTNLQPQYPRRGDSESPQMSSASSANPSPFRTGPPITQIAHAAFPAPPSVAGQSSSAATDATEKNSLRNGSENDGNMAEPPRKTSDVASASQPASSSPESSVGSLHSLPESRSAPRIMPRTSSIDSAISSLSSAQSQKSFDASALSAADIGNLISAAGSAEAVIVHLLKEKHHAASQNSQLWRLVDKQRTLVFGLNKDLDRALKEKEKYKRKAKDLQHSAPPLPTAGYQAIQRPAGEHSDVPDHGTSEKGQTDNQSMGNPDTYNLGARLENSSPKTAGAVDDFVSGESRGLEQRDGQQTARHRRLSMPSPDSDESPSSGDKRNVPPPNRKPPPAPLNLRKTEPAMGEQAEPYDSESEYEDIPEMDDFSVERGRRKTRQDDDREREAALERDQDLGGVFERKESNTPKVSDAPENVHDLGIPGRQPPGARQMTAQFPPSIDRSEPAVPALNSEMMHSSHNGRSYKPPPKSPGLPISPRPEDRPFGSALPRMPREPPNSLSIPQGNNNISGLALSPRAPRGQIPNHSTSFAAANDTQHTPANRGIPFNDSPGHSHMPTRGIYRGFMSEDYPNFLLPPNALPWIQVKVSSSRLRPSRNSYTAFRPYEEEPVFTLSVFSRSGNSELWRVEKVIAALPHLDQQMRQLASFGGKLPDRNMFNGHSPAKVDARRAALNSYFDTLLETPMDERAACVICQFLSSDAIEPRDDETSLLGSASQEKPGFSRGPDGRPRREGYLTKRGKNFGGWKARYFVLDGPDLKYFETPGGPHMGTIKMQHAQIGKQSEKMNVQSQSPSRVDDDTENQYRHAFLILEPKRKDSSALVRHVLCAESDEERDAWVEALLEYVEGHSENEASYNGPKGHSPAQKQATNAPGKQAPFSNGSKKNGRGFDNVESDTPDTVQGFSYDDAVPAEPPMRGPSYRSSQLPSVALDTAKANQASGSTIEQGPASPHPNISGPTNGSVIQDAGAWGNKAATSTKEKKRSIWGFRTRSSADLASQVQANYDSPTAQGNNNILADRKDFVRPVFGIPLGEAVQLCAPQGVDVDLPAVVYRCIEYLEANDAASEEGIFRLSGSNVVVKGLKERFNTEGDVDLLASDQNYDVHAVASLFKQYLRELPTTVLTRELHLEFLRVLELDEREKKLLAFNALIHRLPRPNLTLLKALAQFLIAIVSNSDVNKMTVRNVGIVFAPTLNIPAPVFLMFLTDFDTIFGEPPGSAMQPVHLTASSSLSAQDIRSPRRQIFSEIPTPGYNQASFRRQDNLGDVPEDDLAVRHATGFTSMQPSYEQSYRPEGYGQGNGMPYNRMLSPDADTRSSKAKRRESSFLAMEGNHRTPSISPAGDKRTPERPTFD